MPNNYTPQDLFDNLNYLSDTKNRIRQAIVNKGQNISEEDTFRSYADKIAEINTGTMTLEEFELAVSTCNDILGITEEVNV